MKKIALITYHYSNNHGAVMQSYALCRFLREEGYEVEIIDVHQKETTDLHFIGRIAKSIIVNARIKRNQKLFFPPLTRRYNSIQELREHPPVADIYLVGSDQVWNPNISQGLRMAYFLDFGDDSVYRISYASSFGLSDWPLMDDKIIKEISDSLKRFTALSVREMEGQQICRDVFGVDADIVLDPTFLNESYPEYINGVKQKNLLVCYKLNKTSDFWENTPKMVKELGMTATILNYNFPKKGYRYCFPPSVGTWMKLMASAGFILTDSFHGVAFSIINKKQFVAILNHNGRDSRLINLIASLGLEDRLFNSVEEAMRSRPWLRMIDYLALQPRIDAMRDYSINYLRKALSVLQK